MQPYGNSRKASGVTLPSLVKQLRASCQASARLHGGSTYYAEELGIFRAYAEAHSLMLEQAPAELDTTPTAEGNEHQVWFREESSSFLKATWPDHFGMLVVHRPDEEPAASPIAYLERWQLHNTLFGDTVEFLGALDTPQGLRLLIEQPAIKGTITTEDQIATFFTSTGWKPFRIGGNLAFFDPQRKIVVSDTHRGNIIRMDDGMLAPIDLRVQPLTDTLLSIVKSMI